MAPRSSVDFLCLNTKCIDEPEIVVESNARYIDDTEHVHRYAGQEVVRHHTDRLHHDPRRQMRDTGFYVGQINILRESAAK